jgi:ParB family chromosome partitioning protein
MTERRTERRGLGRGLSALLSDIQHAGSGPVEKPEEQGYSVLPLDTIFANPMQPRRTFDDEKLRDLADSIREKGLVQPIVVRPRGVSQFEIVAGERRWRAAQMAQLHEIPALIRAYDDREVLEIAIVENVQREDLDPLEEASAYRLLSEQFGHTQEQIAQALGKSRSYVANTIRLLSLPGSVQNKLRAGALSAGHARALLGMENAEQYAEAIVRDGMTVRDVEALARSEKSAGGPKRHRPRRAEKDPDTRALEADLSASLGMKVSIDHEPGGERGQITVGYRTLLDLDRICSALSSISRDLDD